MGLWLVVLSFLHRQNYSSHPHALQTRVVTRGWWVVRLFMSLHSLGRHERVRVCGFRIGHRSTLERIYAYYALFECDVFGLLDRIRFRICGSPYCEECVGFDES